MFFDWCFENTLKIYEYRKSVLIFKYLYNQSTDYNEIKKLSLHWNGWPEQFFSGFLNVQLCMRHKQMGKCFFKCLCVGVCAYGSSQLFLIVYYYSMTLSLKGVGSSFQIQLILPSVAETQHKLFESQCNLHFSICRHCWGKVRNI